MPDAYGYAESTPAANTNASQAMYAGVFALMCAALGPCLCYVPYIAALPLGGYALWAGSQVRAGSDPLATAESTMATGGMLSGGVALLLSMMVVLLVGGYILLLVFVGLAGNLD